MSKERISVDFNFKFKDITGKEIPQSASEVIANILYNGKTDGDKKVRNVNWALKLNEAGVLDLNPKEMDDILSYCDAGQLKDGYFIALQKVLDDKREEWKDLQKEDKATKKDRKNP